MDWLSSNWIWVVIAALFVGMHLFGHGHGGHGSTRSRDGKNGHRGCGGGKRRDQPSTDADHGKV